MAKANQRALISAYSKPFYTQRQPFPFSRCSTKTQHKKNSLNGHKASGTVSCKDCPFTPQASNFFIIAYDYKVFCIFVICQCFEFCCSVWRNKKQKVEAALGINAWETGIKSEERQVANVNKLPQKQGPSLK